MKRPGVKFTAAALTAVGLYAVAADPPHPGKAAESKADPAAVQHAREDVQMLDGIYKTAIVVFTDKFVNGEDDVPAGAFAVPWMEEVSKSGTHVVRLIDATGEPFDEKNVAVSDFEKRAVKQIKAGKAYVDEVATKDGKPVLLAATTVPVVMDKCVLCHPHYADVKKGEAIGAITYEFPIR